MPNIKPKNEVNETTHMVNVRRMCKCPAGSGPEFRMTAYNSLRNTYITYLKHAASRQGKLVLSPTAVIYRLTGTCSVTQGNLAGGGS